MNLTELATKVHTLAIEKGWYEDDNLNIPEKLALIHAEISEALEAYRDGEMEAYAHACCDVPSRGHREGCPGIGKPEGFPIEIADALIRILDLCGALGIDIQAAVDQKHAYNATRPHRHGGKRC